MLLNLASSLNSAVKLWHSFTPLSTLSFGDEMLFFTLHETISLDFKVSCGIKIVTPLLTIFV